MASFNQVFESNSGRIAVSHWPQFLAYSVANSIAIHRVEVVDSKGNPCYLPSTPKANSIPVVPSFVWGFENEDDAEERLKANAYYELAISDLPNAGPKWLDIWICKK